MYMYEDFMMLLIHLFQQNDNHIFVYNVWGSFSIMTCHEVYLSVNKLNLNEKLLF